jgi:heme exporter protein B
MWALIILLGTLGFAAVGTFLGSMAIHAKGRETTLPILILPVALPIIMASVSASSAVLAGKPIDEWGVWLMVLASVDAIFLAVAFLLFEYIVEE